MATKEQLRHSILATCVQRAKRKPGRTAMMKYAYLLQTLQGVPLGYRFRLYNYGPYDEDVLTDVRMATNAGTLKSTLVTYSKGYGYEFELGEQFEKSEGNIATAVADYEQEINWLMDEFGDESAARLELISTIFFALCDKTRRREKKELVNVVHEIKPHFSKETIDTTIDELSAKLECVSCDSND